MAVTAWQWAIGNGHTVQCTKAKFGAKHIIVALYAASAIRRGARYGNIVGSWPPGSEQAARWQRSVRFQIHIGVGHVHSPSRFRDIPRKPRQPTFLGALATT